MSQLISRVPATIAINTSLSDAVALGGRVPTVIMMSAAWTAASLTFQGSPDAATYYDLYDSDGTEINIPAAAARRIILSSAPFTDHKYLRIRSGTATIPINQAAAAVLYVEVWE